MRQSIVGEVAGSVDSADAAAWPEVSSESAVPCVSVSGRMMPENPSRLTQLTSQGPPVLHDAAAVSSVTHVLVTVFEILQGF